MIPAKSKNQCSQPQSYAYQVSFTDTNKKYCEYTYESLQDAIVFQVGLHEKDIHTHLKRIALPSD